MAERSRLHRKRQTVCHRLQASIAVFRAAGYAATAEQSPIQARRGPGSPPDRERCWSPTLQVLASTLPECKSSGVCIRMSDQVASSWSANRANLVGKSMVTEGRVDLLVDP